MELTFEDIVKILIKRFILIGICTFVGLLSLYLISKFLIKPQYSAYVQLYVNTNTDESVNELNDLNYAQKIVTTYISFLQTKAFYEQVVNESDLNYSSGEIKNMTSIKTVNNTEIFQITVTSDDPSVSYHLAGIMQEIGPRLINDIKPNAQISIVDPVIMPTSPSSPNIFKNMVIGGAAGFLLSVITSLLIEVLDINVKNREDLEKKYQLPILSEIPFMHGSKKRNFISARFGEKKNKVHIMHEKFKEDTRFAIAEAYSSLRTNLRFILRSKECKIILFTSPLPQEGKSTTCINLSLALAQSGSRVLLMDCDLRKGKIHHSFATLNKPGLSDALSGMASLEEVLRTTTQGKLYIITRGALPPNPAELLASEQMEDLINELRHKFEYIILDTPPINVVSDALGLTKMTDGTVMVVRQNQTSHPEIARALAQFNFIEANMLGLVLNGVSIHQGRDSRSHYYSTRVEDHD